MKIDNKKVVAIHYTLAAKDGQVIDSSDGSDPMNYLHGYGNIIPGLEDALTSRFGTMTLVGSGFRQSGRPTQSPQGYPSFSRM